MLPERKKPPIQTLDDLFGIPSVPTANVPDGASFVETVVSIPISKIRDFTNHPYHVRNDNITQELVRDIQNTGRIETPAIVRPVDDGYEMVSGHRRKLACTLAQLETMPVIVREMTDDEAIIAMVSGNRQREEVLPSEKAAAYKMWMDAMKRQAGRPSKNNSRPVVGNLESADIIGEQTGESGRQVQRFIRLNELIPDIKEMVDNGILNDKAKLKIAFRPAVELSYLTKEEQQSLFQAIEIEDRTPSLSQAMAMKKLSIDGKLDMNAVLNIMREEKPNQIKQFKLPHDRISQFIPNDYDDKKAIDLIVKLLENWYRKHEWERNDAQ